MCNLIEKYLPFHYHRDETNENHQEAKKHFSHHFEQFFLLLTCQINKENLPQKKIRRRPKINLEKT